MDSRAKRGQGRPIRWTTTTQFLGTVFRGARALGVTVTELGGGSWGVAAVETARPEFVPKAQRDALAEMERVFSDHAHKTVGKRESPAEALALAEAFARQWQLGLELEACDCGEISTSEAHGG